MSAAAAVSKTVQKPQLRGLLHSQIKKNLIVSIALAIAAGITMRYTVNENHIKRYGEFYRTYDVEKDFQRIKNLGLFHSCGPNE